MINKLIGVVGDEGCGKTHWGYSFIQAVRTPNLNIYIRSNRPLDIEDICYDIGAVDPISASFYRDFINAINTKKKMGGTSINDFKKLRSPFINSETRERFEIIIPELAGGNITDFFSHAIQGKLVSLLQTKPRGNVCLSYKNVIDNSTDIIIMLDATFPSDQNELELKLFNQDNTFMNMLHYIENNKRINSNFKIAIVLTKGDILQAQISHFPNYCRGDQIRRNASFLNQCSNSNIFESDITQLCTLLFPLTSRYAVDSYACEFFICSATGTGVYKIPFHPIDVWLPILWILGVYP